MVMFAKKPKFDQQLTIIEWIRYASAEKGPLRFIVPALRNKKTFDEYFEPGLRVTVGGF